MNRSHRGLDGSLLGNWGVTWTAARGTAGSGSTRLREAQVQVQAGQGLEAELEIARTIMLTRGTITGAKTTSCC